MNKGTIFYSVFTQHNGRDATSWPGHLFQGPSSAGRPKALRGAGSAEAEPTWMYLRRAPEINTRGSSSPKLWESSNHWLSFPQNSCSVITNIFHQRTA